MECLAGVACKKWVLFAGGEGGVKGLEFPYAGRCTQGWRKAAGRGAHQASEDAPGKWQ